MASLESSATDPDRPLHYIGTGVTAAWHRLQYQGAVMLFLEGNRPASGPDLNCSAVPIASRVSRRNATCCPSLRYRRLDRRRAVCARLWLGDQRTLAPGAAQLGHADVLQRAAGAHHERALSIHSASDLHGTDFGDARFRDWRQHLLGADADPGRRVLHFKCSTRRIRHVAGISGAVRRVYGANGDAGAAAICLAIGTSLTLLLPNSKSCLRQMQATDRWRPQQ